MLLGRSQGGYKSDLACSLSSDRTVDIEKNSALILWRSIIFSHTFTEQF